MKKLLSLFAAALMSASMFASVDTIPTDQVLADYYESGQLCVCVYFQGEVCNDIVWAGTYNGWETSDPSSMPTFEPVDGYDGWYVVAVDDSTESSSGDGICGKPIQLKKDGSFDWNYQTGDAESWTLIRGTVNILPGYSGEADMKGWSTAQPNVLISAYWKNQVNPCYSIPTHNYKIVLDAPLCAGPGPDGEAEYYYAPAIIGSFNYWAEGIPMVLNQTTLKYEYTLENVEEKTEFKFKAVTDTDWSNSIIMMDTTTGEWTYMDNIVLPVATKDTTLEFDFSDGTMYKYNKCGEEPLGDIVDFTVTAILPQFCYYLADNKDSVQIVGNFDDWKGTLMTRVSDGVYTATIRAREGSEYKYKAGSGWNVEITVGESGMANLTFPYGATIINDNLSQYSWRGCEDYTGIIYQDGIYYRIHDTYAEVTAHQSGNYSGFISIPAFVQIGTESYPVTGIEDYAFESSYNLYSITLPQSITTIGRYAFNLCTSLKSIMLPAKVSMIGYRALSCCSSLTDIYVDAANPYYKAVDGVLFTYDMSVLLQYPMGNTRTDYTVPEGVAELNDASFYRCFHLNSVTLSSNVNRIGSYTFIECYGLCSITIPDRVTQISNFAFSGCTSLADIYSYNTNPPSVTSSTFNAVSPHCYLHVPSGTTRSYQLAIGWSQFYHIFEMGALPGGSSEVGVTVTNNYATFSWPVYPTASSYTLEIRKDGVLFCSLVFNSMGQLVGMNFAPSRGAMNNQAAESTTYGYSFVVNGLEENSVYTYSFQALDNDGIILQSRSGEFTTKGETRLNQLSDSPVNQLTKILRNGQLLILRDGKTYSITGDRL